MDSTGYSLAGRNQNVHGSVSRFRLRTSRLLTPDKLPRPPFTRNLAHSRQPELNQNTQACEATHGQRVPGRLRDEPHSVDNRHERDEVEGNRRRDRRPYEA